MKKLLLCCSIIIFTLYGCKDNDLSTSSSPDEGSQATISIENLPAISETAQYVAWFYGEKSAVGKIGVLTPDPNGKVSSVFNVRLYDIKRAKYILVTVEQKVHDTLITKPSSLKVLAGPIEVNDAVLNTENDLSIKLNLADASGKYTLYTPTSNVDTDEKSGVWFVELANNVPSAGLNVPEAPAGCAYQGWVIINGQTLATGKFTAKDKADEDASYSDAGTAPKFPGEDFLKNAPGGLTFPTDLSGAKLFITLESASAENTVPAGITIFTADIPAGAASGTAYNLQPVNNTLPAPKGSVVMNIKIN